MTLVFTSCWIKEIFVLRERSYSSITSNQVFSTFVITRNLVPIIFATRVLSISTSCWTWFSIIWIVNFLAIEITNSGVKIVHICGEMWSFCLIIGIRACYTVEIADQRIPMI
jgi:hypothetical protein